MDRVSKGIFEELFASRKRGKNNTDKIEQWEYLKPISKVITQMDNIEVWMLIGANCMKALESMEIISSRNGGPYAYRKKL